MGSSQIMHYHYGRTESISKLQISVLWSEIAYWRISTNLRLCYKVCNKAFDAFMYGYLFMHNLSTKTPSSESPVCKSFYEMVSTFKP